MSEHAQTNTKFAILVCHVNRYLSVLESALLLGGKRLDSQTLDTIGWWVKSIALEFEIDSKLADKFAADLAETYCGEIKIEIITNKRAALPV